MKKQILGAAVACVLLMSAGCTQSNILRPEGRPQPDLSVVTDVQIDWEQVSDDVQSFYEDSDEYSGLISFNYAHKDEEKMIEAQLFVNDQVTEAEAVKYATDLIHFINDSIHIQNNSLALSSDDSYGGFFQDYGFHVEVIPEDSQDDESTWLVNMTVEAGSDTPIVPLGQSGETESSVEETEAQ